MMATRRIKESPCTLRLSASMDASLVESDGGGGESVIGSIPSVFMVQPPQGVLLTSYQSTCYLLRVETVANSC